jgi:hypothetical protein
MPSEMWGSVSEDAKTSIKITHACVDFASFTQIMESMPSKKFADQCLKMPKHLFFFNSENHTPVYRFCLVLTDYAINAF